MLVDFFTPSAGSPVRTDDRFASKPAPSCLRALPDLDLLHRRYHYSTHLLHSPREASLLCLGSRVWTASERNRSRWANRRALCPPTRFCLSNATTMSRNKSAIKLFISTSSFSQIPYSVKKISHHLLTPSSTRISRYDTAWLSSLAIRSPTHRRFVAKPLQVFVDARVWFPSFARIDFEHL